MTGVALVTGTSTGIGLHAAVELARRGMTVVATMRDTARAGPIRDAARGVGADVDIRTLDVTDHRSAQIVVEGVAAAYGGIDVLINNAGRGVLGTAEQLTIDDVRFQLEVNYLGPVALTKAVLPVMRAAGSGRILTVTSVGGTFGHPFSDAYCGAKFAVEGFMQSLAVVAEQFGVWVSVVEPAAVASQFGANVDLPGAAGPYAQLFAAYRARTRVAMHAAQSAHSAGVATADAAMSPTYRFRWQTSDQAASFAGVSLADMDGERVLSITRTWIS